VVHKLKRPSFVIAILFSATLTVGQSYTEPRGVFEATTYKNDELGITFPLPPGYYFLQKPERSFLQGTYVLFIADAHTGRSFRNRILLLADSANRYTMSLKDYTNKMVNAASRLPGNRVVREPMPLVLGGKRWYRADYDERVDNIALHKSLVCGERRGFVLGWTFVAGSQQELNEQVASLAHIGFIDTEQDVRSTFPEKSAVEPRIRRRIRVSEAVSKDLLLQKPTPEYPTGGHGTATVKLTLLIGTDGTVKEARVVSGDPPFIAAARHAVSNYLFKPYVVENTLVEGETPATIVFSPSAR
jgi:Gram-negative bacterial TonB protein C-terminal